MSVESVGGSVVLEELVVGGSVVGGVVLVGELVVRGVVLSDVLDRTAAVVDGAWVVEVGARLVRGTNADLRERVVVVPIEVAGETSSPRGRLVAVVVVVCAVASAICRGAVAKPTTLPPIAPISIAVTTLTHRRAPTNATGLKRRTPPV